MEVCVIITNLKDLAKAVKFIEKAELIAIDVETDGLNTRKNKIIGLGMAIDETVGFYTSDLNFMTSLLTKLVDKKLVGWNSYFDLEMIRNNFNIDLWDQLYADGQLAKHVIDEERPFALKEVAALVFGKEVKDEQKDLQDSIKKNGGGKHDFYKADPAILGKYCIQDCLLTLRLFKHYESQFTPAIHNLFYRDEVMPLYKEVTRFMQSRGVQIDVKKAKFMQTLVSQDIINLSVKIKELIEPHLGAFNRWFLHKEFPVNKTGTFAQALVLLSNKPVSKTAGGKFSLASKSLKPFEAHPNIQFILGTRLLTEAEIKEVHDYLLKKMNIESIFNLDSKDHLKRLFFNELGETPVSYTENNAPQVNEEFLDSIAHKYDWVKLLQDYNKLQKLKTSYIDRILEEQEDGIFYPDFRQYRTISGRYGSDLQQLPRAGEEGQFSQIVLQYRNEIRKLFISGDGYKFIDADYESLEPHIFAHVSGEDAIKDIFRKGHDFYSTIAIQTEDLKDVSADKKADNYLGKVNKPARQNAKAYSLGIPYGMEGYALSKSLNITQSRAEMLITKYKEAFPTLTKWMSETDQLVKRVGEIASEAGRVRHLQTAKKILYTHGFEILNSLDLYQKYHDDEKEYEQMKYLRGVVKNGLNNAKNFQIQSLAASITNRACIAIARYLKANDIDGYICAQIHDQIVVKIANNSVDTMQKVVQDLMENTYTISIPLKAPADIGINFGESHK